MPRRDRNKTDKREARTDAKTDKLEARAELARAKATKRKWLFFLIVAAIAAYLVIVKGGGLGMIKGLLPGG